MQKLEQNKSLADKTLVARRVTKKERVEMDHVYLEEKNPNIFNIKRNEAIW